MQLVLGQAGTSVLVRGPLRPLVVLKPRGSAASHTLGQTRVPATEKKYTCRAISDPSFLMNKSTVRGQGASEKDIFMSPKCFLGVQGELSVYSKQSNYTVPWEPHFSLCAGVWPFQGTIKALIQVSEPRGENAMEQQTAVLVRTSTITRTRSTFPQCGCVNSFFQSR